MTTLALRAALLLSAMALAVWLSQRAALGWVALTFIAAIPALVFVAWDAWRFSRLMTWLGLSSDRHPPRLHGWWDDLARRIERALRQRDRGIAHERERLAQFLGAIEASPNGLLLLDEGDHILWCSRQCAAHLGLDPQRDLLQHINNLVRSPMLVAALRDRQTMEPVIMPSPGGQMKLAITVRAIGDEGQRVMLTQDVTLQDKLDTLRRDFVANVSHEIRTPLTVVAGYVETLRELPLSPQEQQRAFAVMGQQTARMQSLVGDLLTLAKLEGSPPPSPHDWLDVRRLGGILQTDAQALSNGRHALSFDWGSEPMELAGSESEIRSAIANLLSNAIRYTPAGGAVTVRSQVRDSGALDVCVSDTGPGIAPEHLPRLVERFYRVDSSRSRDTGGTGLGLAIVKHVMQRHGGQLQATSELGKGSSFTVSWPAARVRAATPKSAPGARLGA